MKHEGRLGATAEHEKLGIRAHAFELEREPRGQLAGGEVVALFHEPSALRMLAQLEPVHDDVACYRIGGLRESLDLVRRMNGGKAVYDRETLDERDPPEAKPDEPVREVRRDVLRTVVPDDRWTDRRAHTLVNAPPVPAQASPTRSIVRATESPATGSPS